ncbi:hypothetical protein KCU77_g15, partial [Aureobasidium melanogenum]
MPGITIHALCLMLKCYYGLEECQKEAELIIQRTLRRLFSFSKQPDRPRPVALSSKGPFIIWSEQYGIAAEPSKFACSCPAMEKLIMFVSNGEKSRDADFLYPSKEPRLSRHTIH